MEPSLSYHIFNHANGRENLFVEERNYSFFLKKLSEHILPVCRIYAYCLMQNHFHLFVQIRSMEELKTLWSKPKDASQLTEKKIILKTSKAFSNLFSSYTQAFNKMYKRMGSLFIPSMKTELVEGDVSFRNVVNYIHTNPIHHRFVNEIGKWKHSSYKIFLSKIETKIERDHVLKVFGGLEKFIHYHQQSVDSKITWIDG
ncbi:MAG TPA: transposase [Chitinophagaceae bacterium]|jgi:REP element-mobilizing transposase RayT|nr:transposase [Chitinophagaceae bacterium]